MSTKKRLEGGATLVKSILDLVFSLFVWTDESITSGDNYPKVFSQFQLETVGVFTIR